MGRADGRVEREEDSRVGTIELCSPLAQGRSRQRCLLQLQRDEGEVSTTSPGHPTTALPDPPQCTFEEIRLCNVFLQPGYLESYTHY